MSWLLYGAYGYTGRLILAAALRRGLRPVLGGRDPEKTATLAERHGLEHRAFPLDEPGAVASGVGGMGAVLNAAGPYSATFEPVVRACLAVGSHYLDVTGEIDVLERAFALDARAREAGVAVIPAVGFDVVPSDCLAVRVASRIERPTSLDLAFVASGPTSRGTARTIVEGMGQRGRIRRDGELVDVPFGSVTRRIPFSDRRREAAAIPWGDLSTAYRSTGVGNLRVFTALPAAARVAARALGPLLRTGPFRRVARAAVDRFVAGPDEDELARGGARVWCEARNARGEVATGEITTPNGYALTGEAAAAAVKRLLEGSVDRLGTLTPAQAFGAGFVFELGGVERVEG